MSKRSRLAIAGATGLLLTALPALAKAPQKVKPKAVPVETAVIVNSGSTNTKGFRLTVSSDKSAEASVPTNNPHNTEGVTATRVTMTYAPGKFPYTEKLFADLKAAMPISSLPVRHGMRSASFGTQTAIAYEGQISPDLTFASDPRTVALKSDVDAMIKWLGLGNLPRHPIVLHLNSANTPGTQK